MHAADPEGGLFDHQSDEDRDRARPDNHDELIAVYERLGRTLDDLPYTPEFEELRSRLALLTEEPAQTLRRLQALRKAGRLPKVGRTASLPVQVHAEEASLLQRLVLQFIPTLGQRDRLPYTSDFDQIVERFNAETGRSLSHHAVWRMIARLAK